MNIFLPIPVASCCRAPLVLSDYIERQYGIKLSVVSVGRLLKKLGLSCQKPLMRAFQQDPVIVQQWIEEDYPKIKQLARRQKAEIYFEDEAGIRSESSFWDNVGSDRGNSDSKNNWCPILYE